MEHASKMVAQEGVTLAKATLESYKITQSSKTVATTTITVSEETTIIAVAETAVGEAGIAAEGTMKLAQGAMTTTTFGQSTPGKETNMTERMKVANDLLSKEFIYIYWKDFGQFGDKKTCTMGHYANTVYTGAKEFRSYDTAHILDQKMKAIMIEGVNSFSTILEKYEGFSIRQPKATLSAITAFISKLLVLPSRMDIQDVQTTVKLSH